MRLLAAVLFAILSSPLLSAEEISRRACVVENTPIFNQGTNTLGTWNPGFESFIFFVHSLGSGVVLKETSLPGDDWVWMPGMVGNKARDTFHTNNAVLVVKDHGFWYAFISEEDDTEKTLVAMITGSCHDLPND